MYYIIIIICSHHINYLWKLSFNCFTPSNVIVVQYDMDGNGQKNLVFLRDIHKHIPTCNLLFSIIFVCEMYTSEESNTGIMVM